jgi:hypothetical protein
VLGRGRGKKAGVTEEHQLMIIKVKMRLKTKVGPLGDYFDVESSSQMLKEDLTLRQHFKNATVQVQVPWHARQTNEDCSHSHQSLE